MHYLQELALSLLVLLPFSKTQFLNVSLHQQDKAGFLLVFQPRWIKTIRVILRSLQYGALGFIIKILQKKIHQREWTKKQVKQRLYNLFLKIEISQKLCLILCIHTLLNSTFVIPHPLSPGTEYKSSLLTFMPELSLISTIKADKVPISSLSYAGFFKDLRWAHTIKISALTAFVTQDFTPLRIKFPVKMNSDSINTKDIK